MSNFNVKKAVQIFLLAIIISIVFAVIDARIHGQDILKADKAVSVSKGKGSIDEIKEFNISDINKVLINTVSSDINVILSKDNNIKVHFHGTTSDLSKAPKLETSLSGDKLDISIKYPKQFMSMGFFSLSTKLDVYIPENYKKPITIETVSGKVDIDKLETDNFKAHTTSGNVKINSIVSNIINVSSVSGTIDIKDISAKRNIFKTTSGNIKIEKITGDIKANSISGRITALYKEFDNDVEARTVSGNVKLSLPKNSQFKLEFSTTSGKLDNEFPLVITGKIEKRNVKGIVGDGEKTIRIGTVSGDADINKK